MIWILLIIGIYILGIWVCRKVMMLDEYMQDGMGLFLCICPFVHWIAALTFYVIYIEESGKFTWWDNTVKKFFKKH